MSEAFVDMPMWLHWRSAGLVLFTGPEPGTPWQLADLLSLGIAEIIVPAQMLTPPTLATNRLKLLPVQGLWAFLIYRLPRWAPA